MKRYAERLKEIQKISGISVKELSALVEVPEKTVQNWIYGRAFPPPDKLERLVERLGVNPLYVLTGEGPPLLPKDEKGAILALELKLKKKLPKKRSFLRNVFASS